MRTHRKAPGPLPTSNHPTQGAVASGAGNESAVQVIERHTRAPIAPPPPLAATKQLRRAPLRRMPTELVVTTRMQPVRHADQPATGVRSVVARAPQPEPALAHMPYTRHSEPPAPAAAASYYQGGHTLPYTAQSVSREEMERAITASALHPTPTPLPRSQHPAAVTLAQEVRRELTLARESVRQSEHRAMQAELRAVWAERFVPQMHDAQLYHAAQRRQLWLRRVLQISFVCLALGGYVALLVPLRDRVVAQNAMIDELTQLQKQLRAHQRARAQGEELPSPSDALGASAEP